MPQNFLGRDREQALLLPPSLREWLGEEHLVWLVLDVVDGIDLGEFYVAYRADGHGRAAHDLSRAGFRGDRVWWVPLFIF